MIDNSIATKELGCESRELLLAGDLVGYANLMDEHWPNKRNRSPGMANRRVDRL